MNVFSFLAKICREMDAERMLAGKLYASVFRKKIVIAWAYLLNRFSALCWRLV